MFAAREDDLESARLLVAAGADLNALGGDGKDALGLAAFSGSYDIASFLIDNHAKVNQADAQGFTPLFWAVDRRNMETAPNFPWIITTDPLPLIKNFWTPAQTRTLWSITRPGRACGRDRRGSCFATALMRAAFAGDIELVKLLLAHGADPHIHFEGSGNVADGGMRNRFHQRLSPAETPAERLEVVKLLVGLGEDVNAADSYGITPLMVAANLGDIEIVQVSDRQGRGSGGA